MTRRVILLPKDTPTIKCHNNSSIITAFVFGEDSANTLALLLCLSTSSFFAMRLYQPLRRISSTACEHWRRELAFLGDAFTWASCFFHRFVDCSIIIIIAELVSVQSEIG